MILQEIWYLVHTAVNSIAAINDYKSMEQSYLDEYKENLKLTTELAKKNDMIEKYVYNELSNKCSRLEQRCISLELKLQHNKESFQIDKSCENPNAPEFQEFLEINELKAQLQAKNITINNLKNHIQELKGKIVSDYHESMNKSKVIALVVYNLDLEPLSSKIKNNREAHVDYIRITNTFCDIVKQTRTSNPLDNALAYACMYRKNIQDLLVYASDTCPSYPSRSEKLVVVTPMNKARRVTFEKTNAKSKNTIQKQVDVYKTQTNNKPLVPSTSVKSYTNASGSIPRSTTKNTRILQTSSSNQKYQRVEAHTRNVKTSLNKGNSMSKSVVKFVKSIKKKEWKPTGKMFKNVGYKWVPTGRNFTIVGNKCPLTRFTSTKLVPPRKSVKSTAIKNIKPSSASQWRPKETIIVCSNSEPRTNKARTTNHLEPNKNWGSNASISPCSSSVQCRPRSSKLNDKDYEILFQPLFDEYFNPPPCAVSLDPVVVAAPIAVDPAGTPSSTTIDQDVPSASTLPTNQEIQSQVIHQGVEEQIYGNQNAQFDNAPLLHNLSLDLSSKETTLQGVISSNLHHLNQSFDTLTKLTKNHPLESVIGNPSRTFRQESTARTCHVCYFVCK
ncbi:hypothetical protein Tco_1533647 [Tanacetum coccineum]